jgi:very-short-patch-repair endonuclease
LCHYIRQVYPYPLSILNLPIPIVGARKKRWVDVGIPHLKVGVEYDGSTHFTKSGKKRDKVRDAELKNMGWRVVHVSKYNWKFFMEHIKEVIEGKVVLDA